MKLHKSTLELRGKLLQLRALKTLQSKMYNPLTLNNSLARVMAVIWGCGRLFVYYKCLAGNVAQSIMINTPCQEQQVVRTQSTGRYESGSLQDKAKGEFILYCVQNRVTIHMILDSKRDIIYTDDFACVLRKKTKNKQPSPKQTEAIYTVSLY